GTLSETYFEHAYLARYLGLLLVEGADLTMRHNQIHVRTVAGLKRADVLLRRIDSNFADPLELNSASELGVPGLIEAVRAGSVVVANALGSGVLEAPALMGFIPCLARRVLGLGLRIGRYGPEDRHRLPARHRPGHAHAPHRPRARLPRRRIRRNLGWRHCQQSPRLPPASWRGSSTSHARPCAQRVHTWSATARCRPCG
ncbi:MAG: circularly permuted type 2 ATP-grasp protein, partial [Hyphomicrobium sp.]|nr:circularly permuted type 2 ATP-grasp protein [Hyphomicrobium sp.]